MSFYSAMYEGNRRQPDLKPDAEKPRGLRLLWATFRREWWTLVRLNLLLWLFCLPVVTIPAALKAASRVCVTLLRDEPCDLWHDYWGSFKARFLGTTAVGLVMAALLGALCFGVWFYARAMRESGIFAAPVLLLALAALLLVMSLFSLFPLLAFSDLRAGTAVRNAVLLTLIRLPHHLAVLLGLAALTAGYLAAFPYSSFVLVSIALAAFWLTASFAVWPGLTKYVFTEDVCGAYSAASLKRS